MNEQKSSGSNKGSIVLLLLLLTGSIGFNIYQLKDHNQTVVKHGGEVDSLINARVAVERELASIEMELEKYRGMATNLDSLLNDANGKIAAQEAKIRDLIARERNGNTLNKKLKSELAELKKMRDEYLEKIDNLIAENETLKQQNQQLNNQVVNLSEQKNLLEGKVTVASQLKAEYVKVQSFKKRNSGKLVESAIAKRTNKIDACFTIMDNKVAPTGDKMVYLRIVAPNQKVLAGYSKATLTDINNQEVEATASQKINYTGEKQNLCLAYENDERILESGTYLIEIYLENKLVHQSNYILR